jgi:hypothetical protein
MRGCGRGLQSWSGAAAARLDSIAGKEGEKRWPKDGGDGEKLHLRPCVFKGLVRIIP